MTILKFGVALFFYLKYHRKSEKIFNGHMRLELYTSNESVRGEKRWLEILAST